MKRLGGSDISMVASQLILGASNTVDLMGFFVAPLFDRHSGITCDEIMALTDARLRSRAILRQTGTVVRSREDLFDRDGSTHERRQGHWKVRMPPFVPPAHLLLVDSAVVIYADLAWTEKKDDTVYLVEAHSEEADMEAWDSIAGHSKGLNELKRIFNTGRYTTVTDKITIPYRNGIMHGMDLGYDNKIVAAKSWAALFAAREWALKAEQGLLEEQPEEPKKSWKELFHVIDELNKVKKHQSEWIPRECDLEEENIIVDRNIFNNRTPEHTLAEFLLLWKRNNYGKMGSHLSRYMNGHEVKAFPAQIRSLYNKLQFTSFTVKRIAETAPSITLVSGTLNYVDYGSSISKSITIRIIAETSEGEMALRITEETIWRIMDMNILVDR
ncbi:MAG: hypothetical protein HY787_04815 [Deltaproteobacteria bacterium]|nr:hypothetical protein [Deltaproteobacteria bacterium]